MNFSKLFLAAFRYFAIVFAFGFLLGVIRTLYLAPRIGESLAELLEMPWMLVVIFIAARWMFPADPVNTKVQFNIRQRISIGAIALSILLIAELGVMFFVRHQGIGEYIASRDPVVFGFYLGSLGLFAAMPCLIACARKKSSNSPTRGTPQEFMKDNAPIG